MKENEVVITFKNKWQAAAFLEWWEAYGFDELCESDLVHDILSQEDFYESMSIITSVDNHIFIK